MQTAAVPRRQGLRLEHRTCFADWSSCPQKVLAKLPVPPASCPVLRGQGGPFPHLKMLLMKTPSPPCSLPPLLTCGLNCPSMWEPMFTLLRDPPLLLTPAQEPMFNL